MNTIVLNEQGVALNKLKLKFLAEELDVETGKLISIAFEEDVRKRLMDNSVTLADFDIFIRTKKKYTLTKEEAYNLEMEKVKKDYDVALMSKGCDKFLLNYNQYSDTISIKRMIRLGVEYYENFFGVKGVTPINPKEKYVDIDSRDSQITQLNKIYYIFIENKLKQIANTINEEFKNNFIKPSNKGITVNSSFKKEERRIDVYLTIERKKYKSLSAQLGKMENFLKLCTETEEKYLPKIK